MTTTRRQLLGAGAAVGASVIGRDLLTGGGHEAADAAAPSCTLTPEVTQGPY